MTVTTTLPATRRERRRMAQRARISNNAALTGRATAATVAAAGLVASVGVAAHASEPSEGGRDVTTVSLDVAKPSLERTSGNQTVAVSANRDVELTFDRPIVSSEPAPTPPPTPEEPVSPSTPEVAESTHQGTTIEGTAPQPVSQDPEPVAQESHEENASPEPEVASSQEQAEQPATTNNNSVVSAAYAGIGSPYLWGGTTTAGFDCSGFINWAYNQAGRGGLPRTTYGMEASLPHVSTPQPGDIVLANNTTHGAIYVGNGQVISATPSGGVRLHGINESWHQVNAIVRPN